MPITYSKLLDENERLKGELEDMRNINAHLKANHQNLVNRNAVLVQRPDLPVDRIPAHAEMIRLQEVEEHYNTLHHQLVNRL